MFRNKISNRIFTKYDPLTLKSYKIGIIKHLIKKALKINSIKCLLEKNVYPSSYW